MNIKIIQMPSHDVEVVSLTEQRKNAEFGQFKINETDDNYHGLEVEVGGKLYTEKTVMRLIQSLCPGASIR